MRVSPDWPTATLKYNQMLGIVAPAASFVTSKKCNNKIAFAFVTSVSSQAMEETYAHAHTQLATFHTTINCCVGVVGNNRFFKCTI